MFLVAAIALLFGISGPTLHAENAPRPASGAAKTPTAMQVGRITPLVPFGYGINIHMTHFSPGEYRLFHKAGFGLIRTDFHWQDIESVVGVYDFTKYDAQMTQLEALGVKPVWVLSYGNTHYDNGLPPHTEAGLQAFAGFARAAAAHFRNRGVIWEIWNEPNEPNFWPPQPSADQYASLVKATVPAIRAADPQAPILAGAISQMGLTYIQTFLQHYPLDGVTAFSIHPYREGAPESVLSDYADVRALIARYTPAGRKPAPIVCSEWGYTTADGQTSEADQSRYIVRMYLANLLSGVDMTIFYDWTDDGSNPTDNESRYGIVRQNLTPKPAYTAIAAFTQSLRGYAFRHRLRSRNGDDYTLLFQSPNGLATVAWTSDDTASVAAQTPRIRRIASNDPSYPALLRAALAKTSPYDRLYPDVLPPVPGVVLVLFVGGPPQAPPAPRPVGPPLNGEGALVNPDFEADDSGWTASDLDPGKSLGITRAVAHTGSRSAFMRAQPGTHASWFNWAQTVSAVRPGEQYNFTAWVKKKNVRGAAGWFIHVNGPGGMLYNTVLTANWGSSGWKRVSTDFTVPTGGNSITLGTSLYGSGVAYYDDASLTKSSQVP